MSTLTLCFRVHIPLQLCSQEQGHIGFLRNYSDAAYDKAIINQYADECYLPVNKILADAIENSGGRFKLAFSISGTNLELFREYRPDDIQSFRELLATGCVE